MQLFTPTEYILIDIANAYGLDKESFDTRIEWAKANGKKLTQLAPEADDFAMYVKACLALRDAVKTKQSRHMVGFDATASGVQCLSVVAGCIKGASEVGLIDPTKRCDAYTALMGYMNRYITKEELKIGMTKEGYSRQDLKDPFMTFFYQSIATAYKAFGKHDEVLKAFFKATRDMAPEAYDLIGIMAGAVREDKLTYSWKSFDGFEVVTKVLNEVSLKFEMDELLTANGNPMSFTHRYKEHSWNPAYRAICANVTHSIDGGVVREMNRRCNHDKVKLTEALIRTEGCSATNHTKFVSLREAYQLVDGTLKVRDDNHLGQIAEVIHKVMAKPAFPIVTIHDDFKTYPQFCNELRYNYIEILAELSKSNHLQDILRSIYDNPAATLVKPLGHEKLADLIMKSNYALS